MISRHLHTIHRLTHLASSLHSPCPNHLNLPFLVTKLTWTKSLTRNSSYIKLTEVQMQTKLQSDIEHSVMHEKHNLFHSAKQIFDLCTGHKFSSLSVWGFICDDLMMMN